VRSRFLKTGDWRENSVNIPGANRRLAKDLQQAFPGVKGFSARNIWRMRAFYLAYAHQVQELSNPMTELDGQNLPQAVAEIPWGHNVR
jgi:hypothetical protein